MSSNFSNRLDLHVSTGTLLWLGSAAHTLHLDSHNTYKPVISFK